MKLKPTTSGFLIAFHLHLGITIALPQILAPPPVKLIVYQTKEAIQRFIQSPWRRSTIPQFILDARHPWIMDAGNQRMLGGLADAKAFLCEITTTTTTDVNVSTPRAELEIPSDLFANLEIDNNRWPIKRPGWPNALLRLQEMKDCPRALAEAKKLEVDIYVHKSKYDDHLMKMLELPEAPRELVGLFADVMSAMAGLREISWKMPNEEDEKDGEVFKEVFGERKVELGSVRVLAVGYRGAWMVGVCPRVEEVRVSEHRGYDNGDIKGRLEIILAAGKVGGVRRFGIGMGGWEGWREEVVDEIVKAMPNLETLELSGHIGKDQGYTGLDTGDSGLLKSLLTHLLPLTSLTHLGLPDSSSLSVGFNGGPGCGNVYFGREGRKYERQIVQEGAKATELAGRVVVGVLKGLKKLDVGGDVGNIVWDEEARERKVVWCWSAGGMEKWLDRVVPAWDEELGNAFGF